MATSEEVRSALLGDDGLEPVLIEHKGHKVEIRPPTVAQQRHFIAQTKDKKTGESDGARMLVLSAIACCFIPGTSEPVFKREDEDVLMQKSTHPRGILGKITRELAKLMKESSDDIEGK